MKVKRQQSKGGTSDNSLSSKNKSPFYYKDRSRGKVSNRYMSSAVPTPRVEDTGLTIPLYNTNDSISEDTDSEEDSG